MLRDVTRHLTIGELARRAGVATSALRYYEELGLLQPAERRAGRRYYDPSALDVVGGILLLQDVGFTLGEIGRLWPASADRSARNALIERKLDELARKAGEIAAARGALHHALGCPAPNLTTCPSFQAVAHDRLARRSAGDRSLTESTLTPATPTRPRTPPTRGHGG